MHKILDELNDRTFKINTIDGAKDAAIILLENQPDRLLHTLGVVDQTINLLQRHDLPTEINSLTIQGAFLHDVGYSQSFAFSGFHPYDGFVYLKENGWNIDVAAAVLHHSFAESLMLATHPELAHEYERVELTQRALLIRDIVTVADMNTAPDGSRVHFEDRIKNVGARHGNDSPLFIQLLLHFGDIDRLYERWMRE